MGEQRTTNVIVLVTALIGFLVYVFSRLVRIEQELIRNTDATKAVGAAVHLQNGRIGKLESWKYQVAGAFALLLFFAPVAFWALGYIGH